MRFNPFTRQSAGRILPVAAMAAFLFGGLAFAATVDDQIKARQDEMKANGAALKTLVSIMRGAQPYDAAAVKASLDAMVAARQTAMAANAWDVSAKTGTITTRALPAIWDNAAGFAAAMTGLDDAIAKVAATTDEASFKTAFPAIGQACKNCHDQFRGGE